MSKHELIEAFITGRIGRRDFVRRLTALGVTSTAAAAYVTSLSPAVAASGLSRDSKGYVVRLLQTDPYEELPIEQVIEIIRALLAVLEQILDLLEGLFANFGVAPTGARQFGLRRQTDALSDSDRDQLDTLRKQLGLQRDALRTAIADFGDDSSASTSSTSTATAAAGNDDEALTTLSTLVNTMVGVFAGVIPAIPGSDERVIALRHTLMGVALVQARHASFLNYLIDEPSFPNTFEPSISQDELSDLLPD